MKSDNDDFRTLNRHDTFRLADRNKTPPSTLGASILPPPLNPPISAATGSQLDNLVGLRLDQQLRGMGGGQPGPAGKGKLTWHCGAKVIPHVQRTTTGGEDAHFITAAGYGAVGVADGVGSWADDGVNPADYSRTLMAKCHEAFEGTGGSMPAQTVLQYAQDNTKVVGSSTACLAVLKKAGHLEVANIGDSGLKLLRGGGIHFATECLEHDFNQPYQLAHPQFVPMTDTSRDARVYQVELQHGDIIILGTDGLFNNMWDSQLMELVAGYLQDTPSIFSKEAATQLASLLAYNAHKNAKNRFFKSPFAAEAAERGLGGMCFRMFPYGGKMDDCTVVVAIVQAADPQP